MEFLLFFLRLILLLSTLHASAAALPKVQVLTVQPENLFDIYQYPVSVEAKQESEIHAEIAGIIKELKVQIGSTLQMNQPVLILQHTKVEYSQAAYVVKSPIAGQVAAITKKQGARVEVGDLLMHIVSREHLALKFEIPEMEIHTLQLGAVGMLSFRSFPTLLSEVHLQGISPRIDPVTGTASAELQWDSAKWTAETKKKIAQLYPGMLGHVSFSLHPREAILVPKRAVSLEKGETLLKLICTNKVCKQNVKLGKEIADRVEILAGIKAGDQVITQSSQYLREHESVEIEKEAK